MKLRSLLNIASMLGALAIAGCGEDTQATGATSGAGSVDGAGGVGGAGGDGGAGGVGGAGGAPDQLCALGLCTEDEDLAATCLGGYDACVGRGESPSSCGLEADLDCGVFGGTGGGLYIVCTLGLCTEDEEVGATCFEAYDACVDRGHYPRSCRMEADKTCGVFGETGPY